MFVFIMLVSTVTNRYFRKKEVEYDEVEEIFEKTLVEIYPRNYYHFFHRTAIICVN